MRSESIERSGRKGKRLSTDKRDEVGEIAERFRAGDDRWTRWDVLTLLVRITELEALVASAVEEEEDKESG